MVGQVGLRCRLQRPLFAIPILALALAGCVPPFAGSSAGVYRVRPDGSSLERIGVDPAAPSWSPAGGSVAWSGEQAVWVADLDRRELRQIARSPRPGIPAWRPDGQAIAFVDNEDGMLKIVRLDGGKDVTIPLLTDDVRATGGVLPLRNKPTWSPAGDRLAVLGWDGNGSEVLVVSADGSGLERLSTIRESGELIDREQPQGPGKALADAARPDWSPDGSQVAFALIPEVARATGGVYIVGADGSLQRRQSPIVPLSGPVWSPDGDSLMFVARNGSETDLYVLFPQRRTIRNLTDGSALVPRDAAWSPDGSAIVVSADGALYLLDPATESVELLVDTPLEDVSPAWSPAGDWIAFRSEADLFQQPSLPTIP